MKIKDKIPRTIPRVFNPYAWNILAKYKYTGVERRGDTDCFWVTQHPFALPSYCWGQNRNSDPQLSSLALRSLHKSPHNYRVFAVFTKPLLIRQLIQNHPLRQTRQELSHPFQRWESEVRVLSEGHTAKTERNRSRFLMLGLSACQVKARHPNLQYLTRNEIEREKWTEIHKSYTFLWTLWLLSPRNMWGRQRKFHLLGLNHTPSVRVSEATHTSCQSAPLQEVSALPHGRDPECDSQQRGGLDSHHGQCQKSTAAGTVHHIVRWRWRGQVHGNEI